MKEEKITLLEGLRLNWRGLKLVYSMTPWNHFWSWMFALQSILFTYWDFIFLARLLDHISAKASDEVLVQDVVIMVGGKAFVHIFSRCIIYFYFYSGSNVWELANALLNRKIMEMDYEYVESESIHNQLRDIEAMTRNTGGGLNMVFWNASQMIEKTAHIFLALGYTIYIIYQGRAAFPGRPLAYILFFVLFVCALVALMFLTVKIEKDTNKLNYQKNEEMLPYIRQYIFLYRRVY